jgi:8-oxo-dGTP pyrophosphatase MutT (NUDIX family)
VAGVSEGDPGEVRHRRAARVLVINAAGRVLLLHGFDPARPGEPYWLTIGGGVAPGETAAQAAARELAEESGIVADPAELGEPVWHEVSEFSFDHRSYRQPQDFFLLRVESASVSFDGLEDEEVSIIDGYRWWSAAELDETSETFYPVQLPELIRALS